MEPPVFLKHETLPNPTNPSFPVASPALRLRSGDVILLRTAEI